MASSVNQRLQASALANIENADTLRRIELMAGQRQKIHAQLINAHRDLACRLRRVSVGEDAVFTRNTSNLGDRLQSPDLILGVHYRNKCGARRQCTPDVLRIDPAESINREVGYRRSQVFKKTAWVENRRVFDLSGNDVAAAPALGEECTLQRMIIGFTSAAGEYDLLRTAAQ